MLELLNEPSFVRNVGDRGVRTIEDARGYIAGAPMASYYALESAEAVKDYARSALGLPRLLAIVSPSNESSIRLLEKLGFRYTSMTKLSPEAHDVKLYTCGLQP